MNPHIVHRYEKLTQVSSSLERIEKSNAALNKSVEGIHYKLSNADVFTTPIFSSVGEKSFQVSLSVVLKEKAEIYRPWTSTSLNEWWTVCYSIFDNTASLNV